MRIVRIEIEEFGKLKGLCLEPAAGLTLIEGENESGKSTLLAFLRFAFYGFPRRGGADGEERDKRLSWSGKLAAGQLTLVTAEGTFRIARRAYLRGRTAREALTEDLTVLRLPEGDVISLEGKSPGEYFLGLPPELYEGSLCMTQSGADRVCAPGVGEAMGDLLFMDERALSAGNATARLAQAHRELRHLKGRGGRIPELEDRLSALEGDLGHSREQAARLSQLREELKLRREGAEHERDRLALVTAGMEGAELDRTLALFDDRAAALAEETRCRKLLEAEGGSRLPDPAFVERTAELLRRYVDACAQVKRLEDEIALVSSVKRDDALIGCAARAEAMGGAAAVVQQVDQKRRKQKKCAITGVVFAVLAAACGLAAWLLPALMLYALIGAGVCAFGAVAFLCGAFGAAAGRHHILRELGAPQNGMLRTYLEQARGEAELARTQENRLSAATLSLTAARQGEATHGTALRAALQKVGRDDLGLDADAIAVYLRGLADRRDRHGAAYSEALAALERAKGVTAILNRRLEGVDEAALRARRAALPAVTEDVEALRAQQSEMRRAVQEAEQQCAELERNEAALAATLGDPAAMERERAQLAEDLAAARRRLAAVQMAQEAMETACDELRRNVTPRLAEQTSRIFAELTGGAHGTLRLSSDFAVTLEEGGVPRPLSHFSAGCLDAAHLSLRLALLEVLSGEPLPLLFDEALARLDDRRAAAMLAAMVRYCRGGGQCLLFTCHTRERALLKNEKDISYFAMPLQ